MTPPALHIIVQLERVPFVVLDCLNDSEERRLLDWLQANRGFAILVGQLLRGEFLPPPWGEEAKAA